MDKIKVLYSPSTLRSNCPRNPFFNMVAQRFLNLHTFGKLLQNFKEMKKVNFLFLVLALLSLTIFSCQNDKDELFDEFDALERADDNTLTEDFTKKRTCGHQHHMEKLLADPEYKKAHQAKFDRLKNAAQQRSSAGMVLPMAVHFQGISNPDVACLRALAQSQIDILNADYGGNNGDIAQWGSASSTFPGVQTGASSISFCLATQNHPSGYGLSNGDPAVTINKTSGDSDNKWSGYINIFVQADTGVLGYSPLGGSGNGDGVVIDASAFGAGGGCGSISPQAPYNLGRTLTHELGHYLLLDHVWGDNGGCNQDDGVSDTPNCSEPNYGCPSVGASSCNSADLHMNYMDYTNDACMYMFTAGQATRMENFVASSLQNVANNAANVCGGGGGNNTPTCSDGIQNGNETGVDCGGSCSPCQTTPTCSDGIQNGNETGVDCGGSCPPCQAATADAGINRIIRPVGAQTGDTFTPRVRFRNYGTENLTSVTIKYGIDGATNLTYNWTGSLAPNTNKAINLPAMTVAGGSHTFTAKTTNPNGLSDSNTGNDSKSSSFSIPTNNGPQTIKIQVKPDDYGSEIYWELLDDNYDVVTYGGPYQDGSTSVKTKTVTIDDNACYTFVIYDDYGDGICCDWGSGWYRILDSNNSTIVSSNGQYGYWQEKDFCLGNARKGEAITTSDEKQRVRFSATTIAKSGTLDVALSSKAKRTPQNLTYKVLDTNGAVVFSQKAGLSKEKSLNLNHLPKGTYYLQLNDGRKTPKQRFEIE